MRFCVSKMGISSLSCGVELEDSSEAVADQIDRTNADLAVFIKAAAIKFCTRESLDLRKTFAEYSFLRDCPAEMIVSKIA